MFLTVKIINYNYIGVRNDYQLVPKSIDYIKFKQA